MTRVLQMIGLLTLTCGALAGANLKGRKCIAGVVGWDRISQVHVTNLLLSQGIDSALEGSIIRAISVPPAQADQASKILRADSRKLGYYVFWFAGTNDAVRVAEDKQLIHDSLASSALRRSEYGSGTILGRFLRSKDVAQLSAKYPYIVSMSVQERRYLATPKTYSTGYDVLIELQKSPGKRAAGYRGSFQVYDGGARIASVHSREWSAGERRSDK